MSCGLGGNMVPELRGNLNSDVCARCSCSVKGFPRSRWRTKSALIGAEVDAGKRRLRRARNARGCGRTCLRSARGLTRRDLARLRQMLVQDTVAGVHGLADLST